MTRRSATVLFTLALLALAALPVPAGPAPAALEPPSTGGVAAIDRALARLVTHRRLLVIAAHPDDEDTSLLTLVSRGMGGEAAYLSLSRGEGGQNLIGPELGVGLGLLRTRELLAARQIDGGRQFFTRAYDFGYTRSLDETLRFWPREVLLEDVVRVIRRFRPQVVVSVFPGVPHPNHGQHQAAGVTAYEAFRLAGDPAALPQLKAEGLAPWQPAALYRSTWFDKEATTLTLPIGGIDETTGKSIYQLAMASRSMHRSQDMGRLQELGPQDTRLAWVEGSGGAQAGALFAGVDTRLAAIAAELPEGKRRTEVERRLAAAADLAARARGELNPARPEGIVPGLAAALRELQAARALLALPGERAVAERIDEKVESAATALAAAAGIAADATTERETLTRGEAFPVQAVLWNGGGASVERAAVTLVQSPEWGGPPAASEARPLAAGALSTWELQAAVPAGAALTVPYFLRRPLRGALYDWSEAPAEVRGEPFAPPPLRARFTFSVAGAEVTLDREVVHRHRDQAFGEVRRPLRVVPAVEVAGGGGRLGGARAERGARRLALELTSHARGLVSGHLEIAAPAPWRAFPPVPFSLHQDGEEVPIEIPIELPPGLAPGAYRLAVTAVIDGGEKVDLAVPVLDYPHIRPTPMPRPAAVEVSALDLALPKLDRVGYVRGASDRVPEFLRQAGVPLELLSPAELANADLSRYDAIVVGSRAYETEPALGRANGRLLDYAKRGGLLLVQYQQYPFVDGGFAPLPLTIARPHDRVTDETAPVRVLVPDHPAFATPNRIGEADWQGWVQERGLYFAHTWDPAYEPLLAMTDPDGEPEQRGGLLVAPLGEGRYVYTGLAFFRQLPAGVPGAYRLFANLLGLAKPRAR